MQTVTTSMTAAAVTPTSLPIAGLLENRYPARVPQYQRGYAWQDDHVDDLIYDVQRLFNAIPGTMGHFYGAMVGISVPDASESRGIYYEVVDGQQRLATFCLLLAEIARSADEMRRMAHSQDKKSEEQQFDVLAKEIRNSYLYYDRYDVSAGSQKQEPRLSLSQADDDVFQDLLSGRMPSATRESHELLISSVKRLRSELLEKVVNKSNLEHARNSLVRLRDIILRESFIIHILGDSRASGYRLFAVLNDRGARLTVSDLLRSRTLELLDPYETELKRASKVWDKILSHGSDESDEFLKAYYTALTGQRAKLPELFDKVVDLLFPSAPCSGAEAKAMLKVVEDMQEASEHYALISKGEWPFETPLGNGGANVTAWGQSRLRRLVVTLRHELAAPLLLAARARNDEKKFAELAHLLELFAFRYKNVCNAHTTPASAAYYRECKRLRDLDADSPLDWSLLRTALRAAIAKRATDEIFRSALRTRLNYEEGSAAKANIREFLTVLEDYSGWIQSGATGKPKPNTLVVQDLSQTTIEHIYPQNPLAPMPEMEPHVHRLGNLTYWAPGDNSAAGNAEFTDKAPMYQVSSVGLNRDLGQLPAWDLRALEKREEQLVDWACLIFQV